MVGRAAGAEGGTLVGTKATLKYLTAATLGGFNRVNGRHGKPCLGVEVVIVRAQAKAAAGQNTKPAPGAVANLVDIRENLLSLSVAAAPDGAGILVLHFMATGFELADDHEDAFE